MRSRSAGFVAGVRRLGERTSLRVKLLATVLALAAVGLSAAAVVATTSLHSYLLGRVDEQLQVASRGIADGFRFHAGVGLTGGGPIPVEPPPGQGAETTPTQGESTQGESTQGESTQGESTPGEATQGNRLPSPYYVRVYGADGLPSGDADAAPLTSESPPRLPALRLTSAQVRDGKPFTVSSEDGKGSWRVMAVPSRDGSGVVEIATSLSDMSHTIDHLILLESLISAGALLLMGGGGYLLIRRALAPLIAVEDTAEAIAGGDLSKRVPELDPRTEVGRLSAALNTMLGRIEHAFARQQESEREARASEDRMRRFVGDASHELRTPLTSIRGFAELHRIGGADAAEVDRSMARIEQEATRMGLLVDDLLLLARLDQQRPMERVPVDLLDIALDVVEDARRVAPRRTIDLQADAAVPPIVIGDEARLRQVVHNLMANALTHTPEDSAITVRVVVAAEADNVAVEVSDTGPGMSAEDAARVFERFYRADPARARNAGGSGLGLSIVASLVEAHGGTVTVSSRPGDGATFRVELPLGPS